MAADQRRGQVAPGIGVRGPQETGSARVGSLTYEFLPMSTLSSG